MAMTIQDSNITAKEQRLIDIGVEVTDKIVIKDVQEDPFWEECVKQHLLETMENDIL